jgi:hypothetical protein
VWQRVEGLARSPKGGRDIAGVLFKKGAENAKNAAYAAQMVSHHINQRISGQNPAKMSLAESSI